MLWLVRELYEDLLSAREGLPDFVAAAARSFGYDSPVVPPQTSARLHETGRKLVLRVAVIAVSLSIFTIATFMIAQGATRLPQQLVRLTVTTILCIYLVRGASWARWTSALLFLVGGLLSLGGVARLLGTPASAWLMLGFGLIYLYCAGVLIASRSVSAFFDATRRSA